LPKTKTKSYRVLSVFLKQSLGLAECGMYLESDPNSWHAAAGFADRWHLKMG
jgi:hypothetical protein